MFQIKSENVDHLQMYNIRVTEIESSTMSQNPKIIHLPKLRMISRGRPSAIRITNVKSIKPPDPELIKKQADEKLRAQLQKEIMSRSRYCAHKSYECTLPAMADRMYCGQHILDDPTAPYKQCVQTGQNGVRCNMPAPIEREQGLCFEHARAAMYARQRSLAPPPPVTTTESLLNQLQHYVRPERTRTASCTSSVSVVSDPGDHEQTLPHAIDPFKEIDARAVNASVSSAIMECCSASDSDSDSLTLDCAPLSISDTEDAPCEDLPLWRAGVFTAEEAVREARLLLRELRDAYGRQAAHLRRQLQTARLRYLRALRPERELYCSIHMQARSGPTTARERRQLRKLKAFAGYHRRHGVEAVLARKLQRRRAKINDPPPRNHIPSLGRCTFTEGGVRCPAHTLPATRHCMKHILHDNQQVLFSACGDGRGLAPCREPTAALPPPAALCRYHAGPPAYSVFTLKKDGSDSETESHISSEMSNVDDLERDTLLNESQLSVDGQDDFA